MEYNSNSCPVENMSAPVAAQKENDFIFANEKILKLEGFIKKCITLKLKGTAITNLAKELSLNYSYRSLVRYISSYESKGIECLKKKERIDKNKLDSFSTEAIKKVNDFFLTPTGGVAINAYKEAHDFFRSNSMYFIDSNTGEQFKIHNGVMCEQQDDKIISIKASLFLPGVYVLNTGEEIRMGSYASATRFLKGVKGEFGDALYYGRFGIHDFRNKRQHTIKINYSKLQPNDVIVGDGKVLDVLVISDDWRRVYRPVLLDWYDLATRQFCYEIAETETSEAIANSLAVAIKEWGVPKVCKTDNGQAYRSGRFQQMKEANYIETIKAKVKLARSKPVESMHNLVNWMLKTQIGYTGSDREEMPQDTRDRLKLVLGKQKDIKRAEKELKEHSEYIINISDDPAAKLKNSKRRFMHINELRVVLEKVIEEYHNREHGGLKDDKIGREVSNLNCKDELINAMGPKINTPFGRYEYYVQKGFKPVYAAAEIIAIYAMNQELRTVQIKTGVALQNEKFWNSKLVKYAGEKVLMKFTNYKANEVYIFHSTELQNISDKKLLTPEIIKSLKFICIAEKSKVWDYDENGWQTAIAFQRAEEKSIRETLGIGRKPVESSNISSIAHSGLATQIEEIRDAQQEVKISKLPNFKKFKSINSINADENN